MSSETPDDEDEAHEEPVILTADRLRRSTESEPLILI